MVSSINKTFVYKNSTFVFENKTLIYKNKTFVYRILAGRLFFLCRWRKTAFQGRLKRDVLRLFSYMEREKSKNMVFLFGTYRNKDYLCTRFKETSRSGAVGSSPGS